MWKKHSSSIIGVVRFNAWERVLGVKGYFYKHGPRSAYLNEPIDVLLLPYHTHTYNNNNNKMVNALRDAPDSNLFTSSLAVVNADTNRGQMKPS